MLGQLAKLQTQNHNLTKQVKKQDSLIREEIKKLQFKKESENFEQLEKNKARNQSYIHAKALKDIEQKNENERKHDTKTEEK